MNVPGRYYSHYVIVDDAVRFVTHDATDDAVIKDCTICLVGGTLSVAYDRTEGVVVAHGSVNEVQRRAAALRHGMRAFGATEDADSLIELSFPAVPGTIAELNACIAAAGRVARLPERVAAATLAETPAP